MARELKIWNGRGHGEYSRGHIFVAAYSQKQAAELVSAACYDGRKDNIRVSEIREYYSAGLWGNQMKGVTPTEPCVYATEQSFHDKPKRII